jgi:small subunit ribosomal protein S20
MPQRRTAIKELRKTHTRHLHNLQIKTDLKKVVKKFTTAVGEKKTDATVLLKEVYKKFDKAAKRNVLHKKTAARRKARFAKLLAAK